MKYQALGPVRCFAIMTLIGVFSSGCSSSGEPMGTVSGVVSLDGKPLPQGRVIFQNKTTGRPVAGNISAEGKYSVVAPLGDAAVLVVAEEPPKEIQYGGNGGRARTDYVPGKSLVPKKYTDPRSTPLTFGVSKGKTEFEVVLTSSAK